MSRYESWYFRAVHPDQPLGVWIRHTHHILPDGSTRGARWITLFEPAGAKARKSSFNGRPTADGQRFVGQALDACWDVTVEPLTSTFHHLPKPWMYRAPFPKTKPISVHPLAAFRGEIRLGDRLLSLDGWRGMVGNNWGSVHAQRWIWVHVAGFDDAPNDWIDLTLARVKIGPLLTGWIPNGALELAGRRTRLGGLLSKADVDEQTGRARIVVRGGGIEVGIVLEQPTPGATVVWQYGDPNGNNRYVANCSIARAEVSVHHPAGDARLTARHSGAYELGATTPPDGYPVQPYPDP